MPDFHEVQLDMGIDYGAVGGPEFETEIAATSAGRETRSIIYPEDLGSWQLGERVISKSDLATLDGFFRARFGRAYGFRAKIWSDYELPRQVIAVGDGVLKVFQIIKTYPDTIVPYSKDIKKIVAGSLTVWVDDVEVSTGFSLDYDTGLLTFTVAPGDTLDIEVACEFDTPVRFDADKLHSRFDAYDPITNEAHFYLSSLPIMEIVV